MDVIPFPQKKAPDVAYQEDILFVDPSHRTLEDLKDYLDERVHQAITTDLLIEAMEYFAGQLLRHHGIDAPSSVTYLADWKKRWRA